MQPVGRLVLLRTDQQTQEYVLRDAVVSVGRGATNDIVLDDPKVSREHARFDTRGGVCTLVDLASANGTTVNGIRVDKATLAPGDVVTLGDAVLRFVADESQGTPAVTLINTEADLEMTLARQAVSMTLSGTHEPRLTIYSQGRSWDVSLAGDGITIGRDPLAEVVLDHPGVSRRHARIERRGARFVVRDLSSTNGTWAGGERIEERLLEPADTIRIGPAQMVFKPGFRPVDLTIAGEPRLSARQPRRSVVFVPGMLGSELWLGNERVWPNVRYLLTHGELLRAPGAVPLEPRSILREVVVVPNLIELEQYSRLADYLEEGLGYSRGRDLMEFPYDWRMDVRESAKRLAKTIDESPIPPPITIIAHSLGCLVSRYYVECLGGRRKVARIILLGGPHSGVPKALTHVFQGPAGLLLGLLGDRVRDLAASWPSSYQILPTYPCARDERGSVFDLTSDESWLSDAQRPLLKAAREFRRELGTRSSVPAISIFGYGHKTITGLALRRDTAGAFSRSETIMEPGGDGTIPEHSAVLEGSEIHPVRQQHGALFVDSDVKMRLKLELTRSAGKK